MGWKESEREGCSSFSGSAASAVSRCSALLRLLLSSSAIDCLELASQLAHSRCWWVQRLLSYIQPDHVHVMEAGKIIYSGGMEVADILEADGYRGIRNLITEADSRPAVPA